MKKYYEQLLEGLKKNNIIVVFCSCEVKYSGRAESFLAEGDRMIIIKNDKTLLVHQPNGRNPINWMPEKSDITIEQSNEDITLMCTSRTKEVMQVTLHKIYELSSAPLIDTEQLRLAGTESDMSQKIYENPRLISKDFIPYSREEQTEYGFVDVFGHDGKGTLIAVECKRYTAGLNSIQQLRRYVEKIMKSKGTEKIKGYIAAPNITKNALKMMNDLGYQYVKVEPPKYLEEYKKKQKKLEDY